MAGTISNTQTRPQNPVVTPASVGGRAARASQVNNSADVARQFGATDLKDEMATEQEAVSISPPLRVSRRVTSAEILALFTAPKQLLAAPGTGRYNVIESVTVLNQHGGTDYAANVAGLTLRYTDGSGDVIATLIEAFVEASANAVAQISNIDLDGDSAGVAENAAVVLFAGVANPTLGNGELKLDILYRVVSFPA